MALKLVKDGEIESAPEIIETLKGGIADAEANKLFSIALLKIYNDPEVEPELTICGNDSLLPAPRLKKWPACASCNYWG